MRQIAGAVLIVLAGAACGRGAADARRLPSPAPARPVRVADVASIAPNGAFAPAVVAARSRAVLSARAPAAVTALPLREGDRFAAGALLVRLDDRAARAAHAAAEAEAVAAEADRARAEALLAKGAATPREAEQARARAEAARAAVQAAGEALSYSELRAPFAGTVTACPVHVGDVVTPGAPLLEIEGGDGLELRATLDAREAVALHPGMRLETRVDAITEPLAAVVRSVSPAADPATHRFLLRADLPAVRGLRSGLFARVALPGAGGPERLVVPADAIFVRGGLTGVYVLSEGRARLRWVAAAESVGGRTEVRAGLSAGERVLLDPAGIEDGMPAVEAR
jgi:RND family efflux transporter MFP subunit